MFCILTSGLYPSSHRRIQFSLIFVLADQLFKMCRRLISTRSFNFIISIKKSKLKFKTSVYNINHCSSKQNYFTSTTDHLMCPYVFGNYQLLQYSTSVTPSAGVSLSHVKHILNLKNLEVKDGFTCLSTKCVFCTHRKNSSGDLFINKVTGKHKMFLLTCSIKTQLIDFNQCLHLIQ